MKNRPKIIYNRWLPVRDFTAINLFGVVFARRECRPVGEKVFRHEAIHTTQQREWLYVGFFILYLFEWVVGLCRTGNSDKAYRNISFEREAYANEDKEYYLMVRRRFENYRRK